MLYGKIVGRVMYSMPIATASVHAVSYYRNYAKSGAGSCGINPLGFPAIQGASAPDFA